MGGEKGVGWQGKAQRRRPPADVAHTSASSRSYAKHLEQATNFELTFI
jgi:hypothetical protein